MDLEVFDFHGIQDILPLEIMLRFDKKIEQHIHPDHRGPIRAEWAEFAQAEADWGARLCSAWTACGATLRHKEKQLYKYKKELKKSQQKNVADYTSNEREEYGLLNAAVDVSKDALDAHLEICEQNIPNLDISRLFELARTSVGGVGAGGEGVGTPAKGAGMHSDEAIAELATRMQEEFGLASSDEDDDSRVVNNARHKELESKKGALRRAKGKGDKGAKAAHEAASNARDFTLADLKIGKLYAIAEVVEPEGASSDATNDDQLVAGAHIVQWVVREVTRKERSGLARTRVYSKTDKGHWLPATNTDKTAFFYNYEPDAFLCGVELGSNGKYKNQPTPISMLQIRGAFNAHAAGAPNDSAEDEAYEVECVLDHRPRVGGSTEYLVRWATMDHEETWEPRENLILATAKLRSYHRQHKDLDLLTTGSTIMLSSSGGFASPHNMDFLQFETFTDPPNKTKKRKRPMANVLTLDEINRLTNTGHNGWLNSGATPPTNQSCRNCACG